MTAGQIIRAADTIRCAVYQRVSSDEQNDRRQDYENDQAVTRYGWQATAYREPRGVSASRFGHGKRSGENREVWGAIRAAITAGQIDVVVVNEVSRASRQLTGWSAVLDACREHQVRIYVTSKDRLYDVSRADDWAALATAGVRAVEETEELSTRILSGKAQGMREGRPQGSIAYGIHRVRDPEKAKHAFIRDEPHRETGPVAAEIIRRVGQRESYIAICRDLNARGIPSPGGTLWTPLAITTIAANPVYASAGVVTQAESTAARARVSEGKFTGKGKGERPGRAKFRYGRVMHCPTCGGLIDGDGSRGRRYACHARNAAHAGTRAANGSAYVEMDAADAYIDSRMIDWLCQPRALAVADSDDAGAQSALDEAARYEQMISEVTAKAGSGNLDPDELMMKTAAVKGWRTRAQLARKRAETLATPSPLAGLAGDSRDVVAAHWAALSIPMRKAAARIIAPHMTLRPGTGPVSERIICWPEDEH